MADKSPISLPRLPSASELLENPPVKDLLEKVGRSTVVRGVRSYLDQVRGQLHDRLASSSLPSPNELAERAARYILGPFQHGPTTAINATGCLLGDQWTTVPLGMAAQDALLAMASGFSLREEHDPAPAEVKISELLDARTGAEAALVVHSYLGGLWLALSALAAGRGVIAARGQLGQLDQAALARLIDSSGAVLQEVGATNAAVAADYESAVTDSTAAILRIRSDEYYVAGSSTWAQREELVALARDRELLVIEALDAAGLADELAAARDDEKTSAAASLEAGADLVILRGNGLIGGPPCGILLGRRDLVHKMRQHPMFSAWRVDPLRLAALVETLRSGVCGGHHAAHAVPVSDLLETSVENLQNRAERLAEQLRALEPIGSAEAVPLAGSIAASQAPESRLDSFGVELTPRDGSLEALDHRLRGATPPVIGRIDENRFVLDLRTVTPAEDQQIVTALAARPNSDGVEGQSPESEQAEVGAG